MQSQPRMPRRGESARPRRRRILLAVSSPIVVAMWSRSTATGRRAAAGGGCRPRPDRASAPAWLLAEVDPERGLANDLVHQGRIGGVETAAAHVAVQPL